VTVFTTPRFVVRGWTLDDVEPAFRLYGDPQVLRYLGDGDTPPDESIEATRSKMPARVERWATDARGLGMWAIASAEGVVGAVGLFPLIGVGPEIEVAYHVARASWGRGIAPEAATGALTYAFDVLGLPEVVAVVYPENTRSMRVAEKIGMTRGDDREYMGNRVAFFRRARRDP
jgi:RimJ/RimL family protein N-acetyltransferase